MTQISQEARELLARQLDIGLYHDNAERVRTAPDGLGEVCAVSALSAIQEVIDERDEALRNFMNATPFSKDEVAKICSDYNETIDALRKALDCLKTDYDTVTGENDALRARVQELDGALRPFSNMSNMWPEEGDDLGLEIMPWTSITGLSPGPDITVADLRRAAEAVGGGE